MVRRQRSVNNFSTTLNGSINDSVTSATLTSTAGLPSEGDFYLDFAGEIVLVTHVSGSVVTIVRGQEGTSAASHTDSTDVTDVITAGEFTTRANERMGIQALPYGRCTSWDGSTLTTLTASDFNLYNTATGSYVEDGNDGTILFYCRDHSSNDASGAARVFDSTNDWRITAHIGCPAFAYDSPDILHFNTRQQTGGVMFGLEMTPKVDISATERTTFLAAPTKHVSHGIGGRNDFWARVEIEWDVVASTDHLRFYYSKDGVNWWLMRTETRASSAVQVGIWMTNITGTLAAMRSMISSWHEEVITF